MPGHCVFANFVKLEPFGDAESWPQLQLSVQLFILMNVSLWKPTFLFAPVIILFVIKWATWY